MKIIKYGLGEKIDGEEQNNEDFGYEIAEYCWDLYRILCRSTDLKSLVWQYSERKRPGLKWRIMKCSVEYMENSEYYQNLQILDCLSSIKSELEFERVRKKREANKEKEIVNLKSWLTEQWIRSAIDVMYMSGRILRSQKRTINTLIGRTASEIGPQEKKELCTGLGWDLIQEIKDLLHSQANITSALSLLEYDQKRFVETFGVKLVSTINEWYSRGDIPQLIVFANNLWWNIVDEVKSVLAKKKIGCWLDIMKTHRDCLLKYKWYFGLIAGKSFDVLTMEDRVIICKTLWRNPAQEIADSIKDGKGSLFKKIKKLWLCKNTSFVLEMYREELQPLLWYYIDEELILDLENELARKFEIQGAEDYLQKVTTKRLIQNVWVQRMWIVLWQKLKSVSYYDKCTLWDKLWRSI